MAYERDNGHNQRSQYNTRCRYFERDRTPIRGGCKKSSCGFAHPWNSNFDEAADPPPYPRQKQANVSRESSMPQSARNDIPADSRFSRPDARFKRPRSPGGPVDDVEHRDKRYREDGAGARREGGRDRRWSNGSEAHMLGTHPISSPLRNDTAALDDREAALTPLRLGIHSLDGDPFGQASPVQLATPAHTPDVGRAGVFSKSSAEQSISVRDPRFDSATSPAHGVVALHGGASPPKSAVRPSLAQQERSISSHSVQKWTDPSAALPLAPQDGGFAQNEFLWTRFKGAVKCLAAGADIRMRRDGHQEQLDSIKKLRTAISVATVEATHSEAEQQVQKLAGLVKDANSRIEFFFKQFMSELRSLATAAFEDALASAWSKHAEDMQVEFEALKANFVRGAIEAPAGPNGDFDSYLVQQADLRTKVDNLAAKHEAAEAVDSDRQARLQAVESKLRTQMEESRKSEDLQKRALRNMEDRQSEAMRKLEERMAKMEQAIGGAAERETRLKEEMKNTSSRAESAETALRHVQEAVKDACKRAERAEAALKDAKSDVEAASERERLATATLQQKEEDWLTWTRERDSCVEELSETVDAQAIALTELRTALENAPAPPDPSLLSDTIFARLLPHFQLLLQDNKSDCRALVAGVPAQIDQQISDLWQRLEPLVRFVSEFEKWTERQMNEHPPVAGVS